MGGSVHFVIHSIVRVVVEHREGRPPRTTERARGGAIIIVRGAARVDLASAGARRRRGAECGGGSGGWLELARGEVESRVAACLAVKRHGDLDHDEAPAGSVVELREAIARGGRQRDQRDEGD